MRKHKFYSEFAYIFGLPLIALGVVFMEKADFGVSMVVAPAYILYRWLNPLWSTFTFGMAEYCLQAVIILIMTLILKHFKLSYLLSFATAVIYGFILDGFMFLGAQLPATFIWQRLIYYCVGVLFSASGVSMMFHTYLSPEAYELFVKEVSVHFHININRFKTVYDCTSLLIGIIMSIAIFGLHNFVGVNLGTIICAFVNGFVISRFSLLYNKLWYFKDAFPWRSFFVSKE